MKKQRITTLSIHDAYTALRRAATAPTHYAHHFSNLLIGTSPLQAVTKALHTLGYRTEQVAGEIHVVARPHEPTITDPSARMALEAALSPHMSAL